MTSSAGRAALVLLHIIKYFFIIAAAVSISAAVLLNAKREIFSFIEETMAKSVSDGKEYQSERPDTSPVNACDAPLTLELYDELYAQVKATENEENEVDLSPSGSFVYADADLSADPLTLINQTGYTPDLPSLLASTAVKAEAASYTHTSQTDAPLVLILHTHGTEAYAPTSDCGEDYAFRSGDITQNVVAVGKTLCDTLIENGVPAIQCETMHDLESYSASYANSAKTAAAYLERYPSIKYVLDVHRDAIYNSDGAILRPLTVQNGIETAQVMIVVGTDERGAGHSGWKVNLTNALELQYSMFLRCPSIVRSINLRPASFNQQYSEGSLLLEIGSNGNTLAQAKASAKVCGESLAAIINGDVAA